MTVAMETRAGTTERAAGGRDAVRRQAARRASGPDRLSVILFSLAAFLAVLALLADQLRAGATQPSTQRLVVVRRVYQTTVVETVPGSGWGSSVSQSVSSSRSGYPSSPLVTTRSSSH